MKTIPAFLFLLTTAGLPAQCLFTSVTTQSIGPGCNVGSTGYCKVVGLPTTLAVELDAANCRLEVSVRLFEACGVQVPFRLLAVGFAPTAVALPEFGVGCTLHVAPIGVMTETTAPFRIDLPPGVQQFSFLVQGAAMSLAPVGGQGADALTFSDALQVVLQ